MGALSSRCLVVFAAALWLAPAAHAFCGTYVGSAGSDLKNRASHAVLARSGDLTTLSLAMDFEGDASEFALLIPMPDIVGREDVFTPDRALIDAVRTYGDPRLVAYTCEDALAQDGPNFTSVGCGWALGCASSYELSRDESGYDTGFGVTIENAFDVGGYELVVLSAEESTGLWAWLEANGYAIPEGGADILQSYIDAGVYFVAIRIDLDALEVSNGWLPPLQFRYRSEAFGIPIRIGTISSGGEAQEVVLSVLSDGVAGSAGISNYPEVKVETECMTSADSFGEWYDARLTSAFNGEAGWVKEHSWPVYSYSNDYHCDPCTPTGDFEGAELEALGAPIESGEVHLTRLLVRYTPAQATQDLSLYLDGVAGERFQSRFIQYKHELEFLWPVCDQGFVADPGECESPRSGSASPITGLGMAAPIGVLGFFAGLISLRRRA